MKTEEQQNYNLNNLFNHIKYVSNSDIDIEDIQNKSSLFTDIITSDYLKYPNSKEEIKSSIKRMRGLIKVLLNSIDNGFEKSLNKIDGIYKKVEEFDNFTETNPTYVSVNDPKECLNFYKKLNDEEYTFIKVGELLNLSRYTISNYFYSGKFGKYKTDGKNKITKEGLYRYYVNNHFKKIKK